MRSLTRRTKSLLAVTSLGLLGALLATVARGPGKSAVAATAAGPASPSGRADAGRLVVHEWGTFTGFAGSDGVHVPFRTTIGADLPGFVSNRQRQAVRQGDLTREQEMALMFLKGGGLAAVQRMETPVVYFYADRPRDVDVRVDFPRGSLTEFYPPVRLMGPRYGYGLGEGRATTQPATQPAGVTREPSFLDWGRVHLTPNASAELAKTIPEVPDKLAYRFARDTDAALVQFADADGTRHAEKFLFYRGLGDFTLPVTLTAKGGDRFELRNSDATPVATAFLIRIDGRDGVPTRFARYANVSGRQEMALPPADATTGDLGEEIVRALTAEGLYEKEARAMLATWRANWLGEPGTRVLYIVPRPVTDALLPLRVSPAADETVRVLVGRIDVMTPEQESRINSMMAAVAAKGSETLTEDDLNLMKGLGRFVLPALDRVVSLRADATTAREQSRTMLQAYYQRTTKTP